VSRFWRSLLREICKHQHLCAGAGNRRMSRKLGVLQRGAEEQRHLCATRTARAPDLSGIERAMLSTSVRQEHVHINAPERHMLTELDLLHGREHRSRLRGRPATNGTKTGRQ
jgi:hypothetical protein